MTNSKGLFTISLDFELYWGLRDKLTLEECKDALLGERLIIPQMLQLFHEYHIHATWATVGLLFFKELQDLSSSLPRVKPLYTDQNLSPYNYIRQLGNNEGEDPFHFAKSLITVIKDFPNQEIGSHTFSHYYCLEEGQNIESFRADLEAALQVADKCSITIESIVFPRNQVNNEYLSVCKELGIRSYRGNMASWYYEQTTNNKLVIIKKILRLIDTYINISSHNCYSIEESACELPYNIPSSRFFRPYNKNLLLFEKLRLRRILSDLTFAAKKGLVYHLWWHPYNFGVNCQYNMSCLETVLKHYRFLHEQYGMESLNMKEIADMMSRKKSSKNI